MELTVVDLRWQLVLDRLGADEPAFSQGSQPREVGGACVSASSSSTASHTLPSGKDAEHDTAARARISSTSAAPVPSRTWRPLTTRASRPRNLSGSKPFVALVHSKSVAGNRVTAHAS